MKRTRIFAAVCALTVTAFFATSCEFGLGSQVDTDTPVVAIVNPEISSVKGGTVTVTGTCNDDAGVRRVELSLRNPQGQSVSLGNANISLSKTSWSYTAPLGNFTDGSYSIVATAVDGAERHAVATREFTIDNTPPIVLLSKPNSFTQTDIGSGGFGKTVTISGEILDDNDVASLSVRVFRLMSDGTEQEVTLPYPTFTGFDVQGGLNLVVAQQNSTDTQLSANYEALYDASGSSTQYFTMVVTAADVAGNKNTTTYIKSALNRVVTNETAVPIKNLVAANYKKILNGTYNDTAFDENNQQKVLSILNGTYEGVDSSTYMSSASGAHIVFTVCPDSSPKYELAGLAKDGEGDTVFKAVESGGTITLSFEKGLDNKLIDPSTVDITLVECDRNGNVIPDGDTWTTEGAAAGSTQYNSIYRMVNNSKQYLKSLTGTLDNSTWTFKLPANLSGDQCFNIIVSGQDEDGNPLAPKMDIGYGFIVSLHGGAPQVICNDSTFYDGKYYTPAAFASTGDVKLRLTVVDNSQEHRFGTMESPLRFTPTVYTGHYIDRAAADAAVAAGRAVKRDLPSVTDRRNASGQYTYITANSVSEYSVEIPLDDIDLSAVGTADNYTVILAVYATNGTGSTTDWLLYADGKGPVITVSNNLSPTAQNNIREGDANWSRVSVTELPGGITVPATTVNQYSIRGFWSDTDGSGTNALYFKTVSASETINTSNLTLATLQSSWIKVDENDAPPDATDRIGINNSTPVREGSGWKLAIVAVDNVGNLSEVKSYNSLTFDFGAPTVTVGTVNQYYSRSEDDLTLTVTAHDSNRIQNLTVVAKKNGQTVTTGNSGYTVTYSPVNARAANMNSVDAFNVTKESTQTATITLKRDGTADGQWEFSAVATDTVGRSSETLLFQTIVDGTAPSVTGTVTVDGSAFSATKWYNKETLAVSSAYTETTSGLDALYLKILHGSEEAAPTDLTTDADAEQIAQPGTKANSIAVSVTPSSFQSGLNRVFIQVTDEAGNKSAIAQYDVHADLDTPEITAERYTYDSVSHFSAKGIIRTNGEKDLVLFGLITDSESGVADFKNGLKIGTSALSAAVLYTTDTYNPDPNDQDAPDYWFEHANWKTYANIADKASITAYKATITKGNLSGAVKLTAQDVSGNELTQTLFTVTLDTDHPELELTLPEENTHLNGKVTFSGTAKDTALDAVALYYTYTNPGTAAPSITANDVEVDHIIGSDAYSWHFDDVQLTYEEDGVLKLLGGQTYTSGTKPIWFKVHAVDSAGNATIKKYAYVIDPDADRPVITLSNVTSDGRSLLKNNVVYGSISDDDGSVKGLWYTTNASITTVPTTSADNGWTPVVIENGTFTITDDTGDGQKTWYFYCIDAADGIFKTLAAKSLNRPYVHCSNDSAKKDNTAGVTFRIDTTPPNITEFKLSRAWNATTTAASAYSPSADGDDQWRNEDKVAFGGSKGKLYIKLQVEEITGMHETTPVAVSIDGNAVTLAASQIHVSSENSVYTYVIGPIDVRTGYSSKSQELAVTVTDAAGTAISEPKTIIIDNEAPTVNLSSPATSVWISSRVTIRGSVRDNAGGTGVAVVKYIIPQVSAASSLTKDSAGWTVNAGTNLSIEYNETTPNAPANILTYANATYSTNAGEGLWRVPVWFYVEDEVGNGTIVKDKYINVDGEAGKPVATIMTPKTDGTVGGSLTITGSARDDVSVRTVRVQLDVNGDGNYNATDYNIINGTDWKTANGWGTTDDTTPIRGTSSDWYLLADGTNTWKLPIKIPDTTADSLGSTKKLGIRACAYDEVPQTRGWNEVKVNVDKNTPQIGTLKLVKYNSAGNAIEEREYYNGIYINGTATGETWKLEGTVTDNNKVSLVQFKNEDPDQGVNQIALDETEHTNNTASYSISEEVDASADGQVNATLTVVDDNNTRSEETILILVDRTAPKLFYESGIDSLRIKGGDLLDVEINTQHPVQDSNGSFRLGDAVVEAGSGLSYVAFYFERMDSDDNNKRVYSAMFAPGNNNANRADIDGTNVKENEDGLVVRAISGATRASESTLTHAAIKNNQQVRVGGLIKLGGVYRLISAVDLSAGTVTFTPSVAKSFKTAELVYAQIVDNRMEETLTSTGVDNDDGDGMAEFVDAAGSEYSWNARVVSSNIPDGPIDLHVVAIDAAGNTSHRYMPTSIQNNRPRIAKLLLGTDLNGNAKYDFAADTALVYEGGKNDTATGTDFGEFRFYSTISQDGKGKYDITIEDANTFIVKDGLMLLPEFTGGNTSLYATYKVVASEDLAATSTNDVTNKNNAAKKPGLLTAKTALTSLVSSTGTQNITNHISSFGGLVIDNSVLSGWEGRRYDSENPSTPLIYRKYFAITFWDATEETTQGIDSQWALLRFPVIIDVTDDIAPEPTLTPFYWNMAKEALTVPVNSLKDTSNSVYKDAHGNLLGHIELSSEWQAAAGATTGQNDGDAKVSGIIRIQGTVSDEKRLNTLSLQMGKGSGNAATGIDLGGGVNTSTVLATYNPTVSGVKTGDWSTYEVNNLSTAGWRFRILSNSMTQAGHTVDWELDVDTSFVKNKAGTRLYAETDQTFTVTANDSVKSASKNVRVDIVPYITGVTTGLSDSGEEYARTALGHYPVYIAREGFNNQTGQKMAYDTVTVTGYNLNAATATSGGVALSGTGTTFTLTNAAKSGEFELTVNDVVSTNNKNNNDAHGSYAVDLDDIAAGGDVEKYAYFYNRKPNGINNNILTDDVVLDVWDFNSKAAAGWRAKSLVGDARMQVNPANGLVGFAFSNGSIRFSMPNLSNSYELWSMSYDYMSYNSLAFDTHGYGYAVSVGGDINAQYSRDHFSFMTNRWGVVGTDAQGSNKSTNNVIGLDTIGQSGSVAKNRFQSQSIATHAYTVNSIKTTDVYLAYYDFINKEIRFKAGTFNTLAKPDLGMGAGIGTFIRRAENRDTNYDTTKGECQVIASSRNTTDTPKTLGDASKYVAIAVTGDNTVALVWYDGKDLQFTYTKTPLASATDSNARGLVKESGTLKGGWQPASPLVTDAGEECKIVADSDGNLHIAAYDTANADLVYVYIPTDGAGGFTVADKIVSRVDSYLDAGQHVTIDVAKKNGQQIPYIGYWAAYPEKPRYAYLADPETFYNSSEEDTEKNGTTGLDCYTGVWECTVVPSPSSVNEGNMNVSLWKSDGNLAYSTYTVSNGNVSGFSGAQGGTNCYARSTAGTSSGICYGNGSNNGVMGYVVSVNSTTSYVETAQCR